MRKRWLSIFLAAMMACGTCFAGVSTAWASEPQAVHQDTGGETEPGTETEPEFEPEQEIMAEPEGEPEAEPTKAAPEWTTNPYGKQLLTELQKIWTLMRARGRFWQ